MARIPWVLAVFAALISLASAFSAPTFCKCTCFTNSTIIPLGPQSSKQSPGSGSSSRNSNTAQPASLLAARSSSGSCAQCTRAFCLDYNLPICKGAEEKDVVTMCFQRDSRKDQIIVWGFLLATTGLLGWAGVRSFLQARAERAEHAAAVGGAAGGSGQHRTPLLGATAGGSGGSSSGGRGFFQRAAVNVGLAGRGSGDGSGDGLHPGSALRSPMSSSTAAGPRGHYAPLGGGGD